MPKPVILCVDDEVVVLNQYGSLNIIYAPEIPLNPP